MEHPTLMKAERGMPSRQKITQHFQIEYGGQELMLGSLTQSSKRFVKICQNHRVILTNHGYSRRRKASRFTVCPASQENSILAAKTPTLARHFATFSSIRLLKDWPRLRKSRNGGGEMFWEVDLQPHDTRKYFCPRIRKSQLTTPGL